MEKLKKSVLILAVGFILSSCGVHHALVSNVNNNVTNVELSDSNFTVIEKVSGDATATYILGIGGLSKKTLIENAKAKMFQAAELEGKSRAIINIVTENYVKTYIGLYTERTVTVTGYLVEFK